MALTAPAAAAIFHPYLGSFGPDGSESTTFGKPSALAIDQSTGDLYVADLGQQAIYKFGPNGEPRNFAALGSSQLAGFQELRSIETQIAVNSTTHDFYVVDRGANAVKAFQQNGEPAEFSASSTSELSGFSEACGVAVDGNGAIYVADFASVKIFSPTGNLITDVPEGGVCSIAVDSVGDLYLNAYTGPVRKVTPSEFPVTGGTTYEAAGEVDPNSSFGVAVDPTSDDLYVDEGNAIAHYDAAGTRLGMSDQSTNGALSESEGVAVEGSSQLLFASDSGSNRVKRFGPAQTQPPVVAASWVTSVGTTEAFLHAIINPEGLATSYHFEYGPADCAANPCTASAEIEIGAGSSPQKVELRLDDLTPLTPYYFRVVASSDAGEVGGDSKAFRTYGVDRGNLPDDRVFELVTPAGEGDAEFGTPLSASGLLNTSPRIQRAASDGESIIYPSATALGDAQAAPGASFYLSKRGGSGWTFENITYGDTNENLAGPVRGVTDDLHFAGLLTQGPTLAPGALAGFPNLYLRDNLTGHLSTVTTTVPTVPSGTVGYCLEFADLSADGSHVIFSANAALTDDAPVPVDSTNLNLYEWSQEKGVQLVSVLPDGTASTPSIFQVFGRNIGLCNGSGNRTVNQKNVISEDGATIFWTASPDPSDNFAKLLFARVNGTSTVQVDKVQGGPDPGGKGVFLAAARDGSQVVFTSSNRLTPEANPGDLYLFDVASEELTDLTPSTESIGFLGFVGASNDLSYIYFGASGALAPGATTGRPSLYLWHNGEIKLVATLDPSDKENWEAGFDEHSAVVTPDGRHLAFSSIRPLTGYDNTILGSKGCTVSALTSPPTYGDERCNEIYLYSAITSQLNCVSCAPSGARPEGPPAPGLGGFDAPLNELPGWSNPYDEPRYLAADGSRLFFYSLERLLPSDRDQNQDVYEFERAGAGSCSASHANFYPEMDGCLFLLSTGNGGDRSYFVDASSDARDVFISTRSRLAPGDQDERFDIYDARVGGRSEAAGPASPQPCEGESCLPSGASVAAAGDPPASAIFAAPSKRRIKCPKGKVLRRGHCVRRHHRGRKRHDRGHKVKQRTQSEAEAKRNGRAK